MLINFLQSYAVSCFEYEDEIGKGALNQLSETPRTSDFWTHIMHVIKISWCEPEIKRKHLQKYQQVV